uniref:L1 transposable element RRM domain-containing protein n=1 Tax=Latimeria chalumnae TaxID=7897 RepID=H3AXH2_LATCH
QTSGGRRDSLADDMRLGFSSIQSGLANLHSEVSAINTKLDGITSCLESSERRIKNTISEVHRLSEKCDDLENRARHSNLRLIGLPEGTEGKGPISFMESLLVEVLGESTFPSKVEIERAHQALRPRPGEGERPRMMIFKLLCFPDKVCILCKARELGQLHYQNHKIFFFPDISAELQAKRREFTEARRLCHSLQLPFSLLHPAKLRISLR